MATPTPNKIPTPAPVVGPKDTIVPAGKTVVLVDDNKNVTLLKSTDKQIRIFTQWSVNIYADQPTALADITAKGWKYTPPSPTK